VGGPSDSATGAAWVFIRSGNAWYQQGLKLVDISVAPFGGAFQGWSVALSGDGNTALVGAPRDGSALVFTRGGGVWTQQGGKLVGNGVAGGDQGWSVALSGDGNTAIVGAPEDNGGAAWVYTRSSLGVWTQQGPKLVGTGAAGAQQGQSVSLSADGNTAIVGGPTDNGNIGAAWVFTRRGGVWSQQGPKLVGTGAAPSPGENGGNVYQGESVSLSADGNTALVGGPSDNGVGAAWVFVRSNKGLWTQQGSKLVGTGMIGGANQGYSVALSGDGNTAIVGGPYDTPFLGAAWVYTRSGNAWTQEGPKLVGTGTGSGPSFQGWSVALSGNGNTAAVGGPADNSDTGAAWVFIRLTRDDCKNGGWLNFPSPPGPFTSQGQCVSYFAHNK
jgi:hypothetical protein